MDETSIISLDIRDFGAVGDGTKLNTSAVQATIDHVAANGGGTVRVPAGIFMVGTLRLTSNLRLHLESGAVLQGSKDPSHYRREIGGLQTGLTSEQVNLGYNIYLGYAFIYAKDCQSVSITGNGMIDGNNVEDPVGEEGFRGPHCLLFEDCLDISLSGICIKNAANWAVVPINCEHVRIDGIRIRGGHDGIDPNSSRNVLIANCDIESGDDGICFKTDFGPLENVVVTNCLIRSSCSAIKFGTKSSYDFRNIAISNCVIQGPGKYAHRNTGNFETITGIAIETVDGGLIENVRIENIVIDHVDTALFACIGTRLGRGAIRNVSVRGISARQVHHPILLTGSPGLPIEDFDVSCSNFTLRETPAPEQINKEVIELSYQYPEANIFGVLPAAGVFGRHLKNCRLLDLRVQAADAQETRPAWIGEDCESTVTEKIRLDFK